MSKKRSNKSMYIIGALIAVVAFAIIIHESVKDKPVQVTTTLVKKVDIIEQVSASGKIQPEVEVKISSDVSGEIVELHIAEGDSVKKNQLLAKIKPDNYISMLERAQSAGNASQAQLAQAKARLAQTRANNIKTKQTHQRNTQLHSQKVISDADFEASKAAFDVSNYEVEASKQSVAAAEFDVNSATASIKEAGDNLAKTTILSPVDGIISKLSVERGERVVGTLQMSGTEMMRIANLENMEVRVNVNENDIVRVSLGDTAIIDVDSYTHENIKFQGYVTQIASTANESMNMDQVTDFEVRIRILRSSYKHLLTPELKYPSPFRPGMTASVEIKTEYRKGVLAVPIASVTTRRLSELEKEKSKGKGKGKWKKGGKGGDESKEGGSKGKKGEKEEDILEIVFIADGELAKVRKVKTGISDDKNIQIENGLSEGERIVEGPYNAIYKTLVEGSLISERIDEEK